jgi:hypothetical protein
MEDRVALLGALLSLKENHELSSHTHSTVELMEPFMTWGE